MTQDGRDDREISRRQLLYFDAAFGRRSSWAPTGAQMFSLCARDMHMTCDCAVTAWVTHTQTRNMHESRLLRLPRSGN